MSLAVQNETTSSDMLVSLSQEASRLRSITIKRGQPVYLQSEPGGSLYVLELGRLKVVWNSESGKELILEIVERGEIFGELSILEEEPGETMAEALEDSRIAIVAWRHVRALLSRRPDLSFELVKLMGARRKKAEHRLASLVFNDVSTRLADLLMELADRSGVPHERGMLLPLRLTQRDIGQLIGASREMVSITLGEFRRRGLIDMRGRQVIVTPDLRRMSGSPA